jgi:hypothetical protein
MTFLFLFLVLSQLEPDSSLNITRLQEQQKLRESLIQSILDDDAVLAESTLRENCDPNQAIFLSVAETKALMALSQRMFHYYSNGSEFRPLHLAAGLGETAICKLLIANGAKQYAVSKGYDWVPAQFAARTGHPELAQLLLGLDQEGERYRIEISLSRQKLIVLNNGSPFLTAGISTGRHDKPTPPGMYLVTDKIKLQRSTIYKVRMPYFLRLSFSEVGIHYGVNPGHPASHGCIRVGSEEQARKIFDACPIGTIVRIQ